MAREDASILAQALANLPDPHREIIELRNLLELPFVEIARRMGRTPAAARMLWLRAIDRLRVGYPDSRP